MITETQRAADKPASYRKILAACFCTTDFLILFYFEREVSYHENKSEVV